MTTEMPEETKVIPISEEIIQFLDTKELWVKGVDGTDTECGREVHGIVNVLEIRTPKGPENNPLMRMFGVEDSTPHFLVVAATRQIGKCDCGNPECHGKSVKDKVTFSMIYDDLVKASSDAAVEFGRYQKQFKKD